MELHPTFFLKMLHFQMNLTKFANHKIVAFSHGIVLFVSKVISVLFETENFCWMVGGLVW